ncbi:hypothetical protein [Bythopirellula goksoeyrii]|uniref:GH16 domain-containing protein n=1 Tax=Bythopirellula goksoeyrii TaxID=1400387 RepID=A0A5B9QP94_9BACT|nr:hypothetical protein [Bythopirellula goksoeyrii]QEG35931.1 hypothetical protein Pr1d_32390 [Bythopirellula goksoeyrii]
MRDSLRTLSFTLCVVIVTTTPASVPTSYGKEPPQGSTEITAEQSTTAEGKRWPKDTKAYTRFIDFSEYKWSTKVQHKPAGPGPNFFSDRVEDVWVDDEGLHLTISKRDGNWYCTEVILQESFGYGSYIFQTKTEPEYVDANVIAGMFTWEAGLPWPNRELDFEFARWSNPDDSTNAQFVIQPFTNSGNMVRYRVEPDKKDPYLTQVMTWQEGKVHFKTARGRFDSPRIPEEAVIIAWTYAGDGVPEPRNENIRINLWLDDGKPPASDKPIDLVVTKFLYHPLGN